MAGRRRKIKFLPNLMNRRKKYTLQQEPQPVQEEAEVIPEIQNCPICLEQVHDPVVTDCNHTFCRYCLLNWLIKHPSCPCCRFLLPSMDTFRGRKNSFKDWPGSQDIDDMADNGFYFILGPAITQCIYCDMVKLSWNPSEDPWEVHDRLRPFCPRLFLKKRLESHTRQRFAN